VRDNGRRHGLRVDRRKNGALAVVVKTAKFVLSSANALRDNPDCRFLSVTHITAEGSDLA